MPGGNYAEFLMAGIFVQTVAFTTAITTIAMAEDLGRGIIDRFRSLPMARGAVLTGRSAADLAYTAIMIAAMAITGLLVGWRTDSPVVDVISGFALMFLFGFAFIWIGAFLGISVRNPESAQTVGFIWLFPLTFISNVFVPLESMPDWLRPIAEWNPISAVALAARELFGNLPPGYHAGDAFPMQHPILMSLIWCVGIIGLFVPLSISRYRSAASR